MKKKPEVLKRSFYDREPQTVAKDLLGKLLVRKIKGRKLTGMIVETEAYLPFNDPASHNFTGKTIRNRVMYGEAGHLYVHSSRHHFLMDIVTQGEGIPGSVLIRALEPLEGIDMMQKLSGSVKPLFTNGPAKICRALAIDLTKNGHDITEPDSDLFVAENTEKTDFLVMVTKRVGITKAVELPLRFYIAGCRFVSKTDKLEIV